MTFRITSCAMAIVLIATTVHAQPTVERATLGEYSYDFSR